MEEISTDVKDKDNKDEFDDTAPVNHFHNHQQQQHHHQSFQDQPFGVVKKMSSMAYENLSAALSSTSAHAKNVFHQDHPKIPGFFHFLFGAVFSCRKFSFHDEKERLLKRFSYTDMLAITLISLAIGTGEFTTAYVFALSPLLSSLDPKLSLYSSSHHAKLLINVSIATGLGRLCFGYYLSTVKDPRPILLCLQLICSLLVLGFTFVHDIGVQDENIESKFQFLSAMAGLNAFIHAGFFPCGFKYCRRRFRPAQFGFAMSTIYAFLRLGSLICSVTVATVLGLFHNDWVIACRLCCLVTISGSLFVVCTYGFPAVPMDNQQQQQQAPIQQPLIPLHPLDKKDGNAVDVIEAQKKAPPPKKLSHMERVAFYASWFTDPLILLMFVGTGSLRITLAFEGFLNLFLKKALNVSVLQASTVASLFPIGVIISIFLGGNIIERFNKPTKANFTIYMLIALFIVQICISVWAGAKPDDFVCDSTGCFAGIGILLFMMGLMLGYPYFIPPAVFALSFGQDSPMMIGLIECIAGGFSALFVSIASPIVIHQEYAYLVVVLVPFSFIAAVCHTVFHWLQLKQKKQFKLAVRILHYLHVTQKHKHGAEMPTEEKAIAEMIEKNAGPNHPIDSSNAKQIAQMVHDYISTFGLGEKGIIRKKTSSIAEKVSSYVSGMHMPSYHHHHASSLDSNANNATHEHDALSKFHFRSKRHTPLGRLRYFHKPSQRTVWIASVLSMFILIVFFSTYFIAVSNPDHNYNYDVWFVSNNQTST